VWRHRDDLISRFGQDGIVARYTKDIRTVLGRDRRLEKVRHDACSEQASGLP
jgi:hypothetical protein